MKAINSYIRIFSNGNQSILQVDTWELKDYIEDYLCEQCDIDYEFYMEINPELREENNESYNLYFSNKYAIEEIESSVLKLDKKEIYNIVESQKNSIDE